MDFLKLSRNFARDCIKSHLSCQTSALKQQVADLTTQLCLNTGAKGYQKKVLYACVKQQLPLCIEEWRDIAAIYQARSGEELVRDAASIRTHWETSPSCCNRGQTPTGQASGFVAECQEVAFLMGERAAVDDMGGSSEEEQEGTSIYDSGGEESDITASNYQNAANETSVVYANPASVEFFESVEENEADEFEPFDDETNAMLTDMGIPTHPPPRSLQLMAASNNITSSHSTMSTSRNNMSASRNNMSASHNSMSASRSSSASANSSSSSSASNSAPNRGVNSYTAAHTATGKERQRVVMDLEDEGEDEIESQKTKNARPTRSNSRNKFGKTIVTAIDKLTTSNSGDDKFTAMLTTMLAQNQQLITMCYF